MRETNSEIDLHLQRCLVNVRLSVCVHCKPCCLLCVCVVLVMAGGGCVCVCVCVWGESLLSSAAN